MIVQELALFWTVQGQ